MNLKRQEFDASTKLVGFLVGIALLFLAALFVGDKFGPDAPSVPHSSHTGHDSAFASTVVHTAEFTTESEEGGV